MSKLSKRLKALLTAVAVIAALAALPFPVVGPAAAAGTPNVAVGAGQVVTIPIFISGQRTATVAAAVLFAMPFPCDILGISASARASGGTTPTLTVDVLASAVSILSTPVAVTAAAVAQAVVVTTAIADETAMTISLAITGTTPTWDDIMVLITVSRR